MDTDQIIFIIYQIGLRIKSNNFVSLTPIDAGHSIVM
jgi:hypothetical protein